MAEPTPTEVAPWYLRNITQALALDETTGNVYVRTDADISIANANITVGNVGITSFGNVDISGNTLPVTIDSGNVTVTQGTDPWMIEGNVAITNTPDVTGNVTVTQGTSPWIVEGNVSVTGNANVVLGGTNLDAFGRLRVSNPVTLFDSQNYYLDGQQFSTITAGGGTRTYVQNESSFNLAVGTASGDSVIVQSYTTQAYQPGKSLLALDTFCLATLKANLRQRVGHFTSQNGVFFEADGTTLNMVIRSYTSGAVVENRVPRASWNGDPLDGSGPSGINFDPAVVQIFWLDIEWLGVGAVRTGFVINGQFIVCHTFYHANVAGNTKVYMTTATLNPRYEITNTGVTGSSSTMKQICSTVMSEGGYNPSVSINYSTNGTNVTRVSAANTLTSLTSIRLNPSYPDAVVLPSQVDLLLIDVRYGQFQLIEGATLANAVWSNASATSVVQTSATTDTITDGTVVYAGITSSRDSLAVSEDIAKRLQLKRHANGAPITLTLAVAYTQTNTDLLWKFGWSEITN